MFLFTKLSRPQLAYQKAIQRSKAHQTGKLLWKRYHSLMPQKKQYNWMFFQPQRRLKWIWKFRQTLPKVELHRLYQSIPGFHPWKMSGQTIFQLRWVLVPTNQMIIEGEKQIFEMETNSNEFEISTLSCNYQHSIINQLIILYLTSLTVLIDIWFDYWRG